jgi:hypothetical protein
VLAERTLRSLSDAGNRLNTRNMQLTLSIPGSNLKAMSGIGELLKATDGTYKSGKVG